MYVRAPPRLVRSACWIAGFDLVATGLVWFWAEGWDGGDFWSHQVRGVDIPIPAYSRWPHIRHPSARKM